MSGICPDGRWESIGNQSKFNLRACLAGARPAGRALARSRFSFGHGVTAGDWITRPPPHAPRRLPLHHRLSERLQRAGRQASGWRSSSPPFSRVHCCGAICGFLSCFGGLGWFFVRRGHGEPLRLRRGACRGGFPVVGGRAVFGPRAGVSHIIGGARGRRHRHEDRRRPWRCGCALCCVGPGRRF